MRTFLPVTFVIVATTLFACSSNDTGTNSSTSSSTPDKSCAGLQKCCDKASEPTKSSCNAATAAKVEQACAAAYDAVCGGAGDGGTEGGATGQVASQCATFCANMASANCPKPNVTCQKDCVKSFDDAKSKDCINEWTASVKCSATATFTCSDGEPTTSSCSSDTTALASCMQK